jgi:RNA-dependent RNA polymerase
LKLSQLHSDAVDFQKSGRPVPMDNVPRLLFRAKPDWNAPETVNPDSARYYTSTKAIGHLFRAINLPSLEDAAVQARAQKKQMRRRRRGDLAGLEEAMAELSIGIEGADEDPVAIVLRARISEYLEMDDTEDDTMLASVGDLFEKYTSELRYICATHSLAQRRKGVPLTEEEVMVGTIVAQTSQPRKRKEVMGKMRDQSAILVNAIRGELAGDDEMPMEMWLKKAWIAWRFSMVEADNDTFGAKSFGIIAIGSVSNLLCRSVRYAD